MRIITYGEHKYQISELHYKKLLRRFDASMAKINTSGQYCVAGKSICWNRKFKCLKCSLRSPQKRIVSCTYLFNKIMGEELSEYIYMMDYGIIWNTEDDKYARQALEAVRNVLLKSNKMDSK